MYKRQGFTATAFEEGLRQSLATQQLRDGVVDSTLITAAEQDQIVALLKQQRELQYLVLPLEKYVAQSTVDDAAIRDYFEANKSRFVNPEQAQLQFVELNLSEIAEGITLSEADLKASDEEPIANYCLFYTSVVDKRQVVPEENRKDLAEIPENIRAKIDVRPVRCIDQVL